MRRERHETIIAVNFRGCVVPTGLALYELLHLAAAGAPTLSALLVAGGVNIAVCYFAARPVPGVGILLPGLLPAAVRRCWRCYLPRGRRRLSPTSPVSPGR
jgi:uncharacterized membrane protein